MTQEITYREFLALNLDYRCELIDGFLKAMSAVNEFHMRITSEMCVYLNKLWKQNKQKYIVFHAPFDVLLFPNSDNPLESKMMVQPDLGICLPEKRKGRLILGAPELLIEVTSSNPAYDCDYKKDLYHKAGVKEYWIIFPRERIITIYLLSNDYKNPNSYEFIDEDFTISSKVIPEFEVNVADIFDFTGLE
jgi:Uma2 family endonuclease